MATAIVTGRNASVRALVCCRRRRGRRGLGVSFCIRRPIAQDGRLVVAGRRRRAFRRARAFSLLHRRRR